MPIRPRRALLSGAAVAALVAGAAFAAATPAFAEDVPPVVTIAGSNTGINTPYGVAVDSLGNRYVANFEAGTVTVYSSAATGNATPIRTIGGAATTLSNPTGVAVDAAGDLFVANGTNIVEFAPGADGDVLPTQTIAGTVPVFGIALDTDGNVYGSVEGAGGFVEYAAGSSGTTTPIRTVTTSVAGSFSISYGVAVAADGTVYVTNFDFDQNGGDPAGSVEAFGPSASGAAAPLRTITGVATGLGEPIGIAISADGLLYVANLPANGTVPGIQVFASTATGDVVPVRTIAGVDSGITFPIDVAVDPQGNVYVVDLDSNALSIFGTVAPTVTAVTPTKGSTAGGTRITITGTNFTAGTTVTVGGVAATDVTITSLGSLTAVVPAHKAGSSAIVVTTVAGSATAAASFTYVAPAAATPPTGSGTTSGAGTTTAATGTTAELAFTGSTDAVAGTLLGGLLLLAGAGALLVARRRRA